MLQDGRTRAGVTWKVILRLRQATARWKALGSFVNLQDNWTTQP